MYWTDLAQDMGQVAGTCKCGMNFQVPYNAGNLLTS